MRKYHHSVKPGIIVLFWLGILLAAAGNSFAQKAARKDIKGFIKDAWSGEALPFANVFIKGTNYGSATNTDGYFVIVNAPVGPCSLTVYYIGYISKVIGLNNKSEGIPALQIKLEPTVLSGEGVVVTANREMLEASTKEVSQVTISPRQLSSLPSIGEVDVFRSIQLLPGISAASEGESGLYVRGGTPDQNLILFDGMTIYHVDHFFGFFSAFNADAIKDIQVFKGGFPAQYGGRISSVVNLTGKSGDMNNLRFGMGANLLSANAYVEIPLFDKGTFLLAARRSYTDFIRSPLYDSIYKLMTGEESGSVGPGVRGGMQFGGMQQAEFQPAFYFYDLNSKLTLFPSMKDVLTVSFYSGKDDLDKSQDYSGMEFRFPGSEEGAALETKDFTRWGNLGSSGKWSRQWNNRLHTDMLVAYSKYFSTYDRSTSMEGQSLPNDSTARRRGFGFASVQDNDIKDMTFRMDTDWHVSPSHTLRLGTWISQFDSRYTATMNDTITFFSRTGRAWQYAAYFQDRWKIKSLELTLGLRASQYEKTQRMYYEPRASSIYHVNSNLRLKGAWGYYYQLVNLFVNENVT
ncbi:MAG: TonB-dependent receptor [bacterium]